MFETTLAAFESKRGPGHPDTLAVRLSLVDAYQSAGRTNEAIELLKIQESHLPPDCPETRKTRLDLMQRYYALGAFDRVLPYYRDRYHASLREHGPRHIDTLLAMRDLAELYAQSRRYDLAEPLFLEALEGLDDRPKNDPIVVLTETYLATMYESQGRYAQAEGLLRRRVEVAHDQFGPTDSRTAGPMAQLALCLLEQDQWLEAEPILRECLAIREQAQPERLGYV